MFAIWRNVEEFGDVVGDDAKDDGLRSGEMLTNLEMLEEMMRKTLVCNLENGAIGAIGAVGARILPKLQFSTRSTCAIHVEIEIVQYM